MRQNTQEWMWRQTDWKSKNVNCCFTLKLPDQTKHFLLSVWNIDCSSKTFCLNWGSPWYLLAAKFHLICFLWTLLCRNFSSTSMHAVHLQKHVWLWLLLTFLHGADYCCHCANKQKCTQLTSLLVCNSHVRLFVLFAGFCRNVLEGIQNAN